MAKGYTQEEFVAKMAEVNPNIDLSEYVYTKSINKGHCKCKVCGNEWDARADTLLRGVGCRKCFDKRNAASKLIPMEKVQQTIDESGANATIIGKYIDTKHDALFKCNECGNEWESLVRDVMNGHGCPECGRRKNSKARTRDEFLTTVRSLYGNKYTYLDLPEKVPNKETIHYICPEHGLITETCESHLRRGCPKCLPKAQVKSGETAKKHLNDFVSKLGIKVIKDWTCEWLYNMKFDYFFPDYDLAIDLYCEANLPEMTDEEIHKREVKHNLCREHKVYTIYFYQKTCRKYFNPKWRGISTTKQLEELFEKLSIQGKELFFPPPKPPKERVKRERKPKARNPRKYATNEEWYSAMHNRFAKTNEQFITEAREVHGDKYDYSLVDYKDNITPVDIICPDHGVFSQIPKSHLKGHGCPICGNIKVGEKIANNPDEVMEKLKEIWGDEYDFSEAVYVRANQPMKVICHHLDKDGNEHGPFYPQPSNLLNGHGCLKCGLERAQEKTRLPYSEFLERANAVHNGRYQYIEETYKGYDELMTMICPDHGEFQQRPHNHLAGQGCQKCGSIKGGLAIRLTQEEFIRRCTEVHNGKYDYSQVVYDGLTNKIKPICPKHGMFEQRAGVHLNGSGCPKCRTSNLERKITKVLDKDFDVDYVYNYRVKWLGMQSLDFYIPDYNIGIECQGAQHFEKDYYNRKHQDPEFKNYYKVVERDQRKNKLCKENGVNLVYYFDKYFNDKYQFDNPYFNNIEDLITYIKSQPETENNNGNTCE